MEASNKKMKENKEQVQELRQLFKEEYLNNQDLYHKDDYERIMEVTNDWHCWRYLNHYSFDLKRAFDNMKSTLKWRQEFGINDIKNSDFPKEIWLFSLVVFAGRDKDGNVMLYLKGKIHRAAPDELRDLFIRFIAHGFDTNDRSLCDTERLVVVFDQTNTTFANFDLSVMKWLISVRNNWPSRLGAILVTGIPYLVQPVVRLIISWVPVELRYLIFCGSTDDLVKSRVDKEQLLEYLGGDLDESPYRIAPPGYRWAKDLKMFQEERALMSAFEKWTHRWAPDEEHRQRMIDLQLKFDAKSRST